MRKFTFKSLLIAAALCLGTSAWAEEVTATLVHTASTSCGKNVAEVTGTVDAEKEHYNNEGSGTWQGYAFAEFEIEIPENQVVVSAQLTWTGTTTTKARDHKLYYLNLGNELDYNVISTSPILLRYNGNKKHIVTESFANEATKVADVTSAINDVYDNKSNKIIFQWTGNAGGGDLYGKASAKAPKLVITTAEATATTSYTINYLDESKNLLKSVTVEGAVIGSLVTASNEELASFFNGDKTKKYIYKSGNEEITLVKDAANNVITLVFREAETYSYTIKATDGTNVLKTIASGSNFEGETVKYAYNYYINNEATLYTKAAATNKEFNGSFVLTEDKQTVNVVYTKTDISNVVYWSEAEEIDGAIPQTGSNANIRCSNSIGASFAENTTIVNLPAGKYKIWAQVWGNKGTTFNILAGETIALSVATQGYILSGSSEINLVSNTDIIIAKAGDSGKMLDCLYIQKTGDATTQNVTVGSNGIATFTPNVALDFTNATNIKAYTATVSETTVTLTETKTVAAGEGVIIQSVNGGEATEAIAVANPATATEGNALVGTLVDIAALATTDGTYNNYILNIVDGKAGFYQANDKKVAAGKAYLQVPVANGAKALTIVWNDGETTGIKENYEFGIMNSDAATYDLSGRKVANPAKGLYIKNGKKFIVK